MGVEIPEWLNLFATFIIIVVVGVTTRLASLKASGVKQAEEAEVVGAVVDARAVKSLAELIEFSLDRVINIHDEKIRHDRYQMDELNSLRKEIRELTSAIRESSTKGV